MRKSNISANTAVGDGSATPASDWLGELYGCYAGELSAYLRRSFGLGPPEPDDVVQLAFEKLAEQPGAEAVRNPRGFLYRVAKNIIISEKRKAGTRARYASDASHEIFAALGDQETPERVYLDKERQARLRAAFETLPRRRRRMFIMNRALGMSYDAIARRFGVSASTVRNEICRAILALDALLGDAADDALPKD